MSTTEEPTPDPAAAPDPESSGEGLLHHEEHAATDVVTDAGAQIHHEEHTSTDVDPADD